MSYVKGLRCRECGGETPVAPLHVCEICFGPLEVVYDYAAIRRVLTRETIAARPRNLWRYHELLPLDGEPRVGFHSGFTPLIRADRLAAALGVEELWVKDDSVNHPTFSYKDRVVSVAISKAMEFGFDTVNQYGDQPVPRQKATLEVVETEPSVKGQTAASSYKPALLSNGVRTMVPPFVGPGTKIVVMTADGSYVERAKD